MSAPSIIVNCSRTHSNLLQIVAETDGLFMFYLWQDDPNVEPKMMGEGEFIDYASHPEARDIVTVTPFTTFWDPDMLWSLATINEDAAITALGHYAIHNDAMWVNQSVPVGDQPQADVA